MIIIKTKTGEVLLNDKTTQQVEHNKEKGEVTVTFPYNKPRPKIISDVLSLNYTNDLEPIRYNSDGLDIEGLKKQVEIEQLKAREMSIIIGYVRFGYWDLRSFVEKLLDKKALDTEEKLKAQCLLSTIDQRIENDRPLLEEVRDKRRKLEEVNPDKRNTEIV